MHVEYLSRFQGSPWLIFLFGSFFFATAPLALDAQEEEPSTGFENGSLVALPIPFNEPTFGTGLALGGGYLFQLDEGSDTSFIGGGVFGTNEGSQAVGLGGSFSVSSGRYNGFGFLAAADLVYDLFIAGQPLEIEQSGVAFQGEFRYGFTPEVSAGFALRYLESEIEGANGSSPPTVLENIANTSIGSLGLVANWDTRDSTFYPEAGGLLAFDLTQYQEFGGADLEYTRATLGYNHFWSIGTDAVVGARFSACGVDGRAPFFDTCLLGSEVRGYSIFEYYGDQLLAAQVEYRGRFNHRFGYVGFLGAGEVQKSTLGVDSGTRIAGGVGLRLRVSEEFKLDMSLDAAINDNDETTAYLYVGQSF